MRRARAERKGEEARRVGAEGQVEVEEASHSGHHEVLGQNKGVASAKAAGGTERAR